MRVFLEDCFRIYCCFKRRIKIIAAASIAAIGDYSGMYGFTFTAARALQDTE